MDWLRLLLGLALVLASVFFVRSYSQIERTADTKIEERHSAPVVGKAARPDTRIAGVAVAPPRRAIESAVERATAAIRAMAPGDESAEQRTLELLVAAAKAEPAEFARSVRERFTAPDRFRPQELFLFAEAYFQTSLDTDATPVARLLERNGAGEDRAVGSDRSSQDLLRSFALERLRTRPPTNAAAREVVVAALEPLIADDPDLPLAHAAAETLQEVTPDAKERIRHALQSRGPAERAAFGNAY